jgi:hypothetical protein
MNTPSFPLDLRTINSVQEVVVREIRNQVCQWEQDALDAGAMGDFRSAQQFRDWAFAAELAASKAFTACTAVFLDTCNALPLVEDQRTVQLPNLNRTAQDLRLDALALEVVSEMPAPTA